MNPGNNTGSQPYLPDVGVVALVPDHWGGVWQPRHHVLSRLSAYFNVVWVGPMRGWRELWCNGGRPPDAAGQRAGRGFALYRQDVWLPRLYRPGLLARLTAQQQLRRAQSLVQKRGARATVLYLWRPRFHKALDHLRHDLSVYHIDDEYSFSPVEQELDPIERKLISRVDQVFIHSSGLMEKKGGINPNTLLVPNGVDFHAYATPSTEPEDLKRIPHPRIGYVGRIKWQLDLDLLLDLARRHSTWAFIMVGPIASAEICMGQVDTLRRMSNVHFLGQKKVDELPGYVQHLDVCLLPYEVNGYTNFIYPMKLHEYLAAGRPVVGSLIRSLKEFAHVVTLAGTVEEWSAAIRKSLAFEANTSQAVELRRGVARRHDWRRLVGDIAGTICKRLGAPYARRFTEILARERATSPDTVGISALFSTHDKP